MKDQEILGVGPAVSPPATPHPVWRQRLRRSLMLLALACCLPLALLLPAHGGDGALDPTFIMGAGPYDPYSGVQFIPEIRGLYAYTTVTGSPYNNYSLLFGNFNAMNVGGTGRNANSICRLTNTGALDTAFQNPQLNGEIRAVYIYPHNYANPSLQDKILIGGNFNVSSGTTTYCNFARLNANGSLDTTLPVVIQWRGAVNAIGVQSTGNILVGGYDLDTNNGDGPQYQLLRLTEGGSLDSSYTHWGWPGGYISGVKVFAAGDPYPADYVRLWCSYPKNQDGAGGTYYALLLNANAALPSITSPPIASIGDETVDGPIFNMARQSDGKFIIVGQFTKVKFNGVWYPRNRVARLGSDFRTLDLGYTVAGGPNGAVHHVSAVSDTDNRMILSGNFSAWNGSPCGYLVRLTDTGAVDSFNSGAGASDRIMHLFWNGDGTGGVIAGYFRSYNGQTRGGIARLNEDGSYNNNFANITASAGYGGMVYSLAAQKDGRIIIGGDFNGVCGKHRGGLARINANGSLDDSFKGVVDGTVYNVAVQADGKILLAGYFGQCQGYACTSLARLNPDGSLDAGFKPLLVGDNNGLNRVRQVAPLANGQLMIAGEFWNLLGVWSPVVRLNGDGSVDYSFDASQFRIPGVDYGLWANRVVPVGDKYLIAGGNDTGGSFYFAGGYLARLTSGGATDNTFGPATHVQTFDREVSDLQVQGDGKVLVSGMFAQVTSEAGTPARTSIARFSANGLLDNTFTPNLTGANTLIIATMALQPNGKVLIEENFVNISGNNYVYLSTQVARLNGNGSLDPAFTIGNPQYGYFNYGGGNSILRLPSGKALIGGSFTNYNGMPAFSLVRIFAGPANFSPADLLLLLVD